MAITNIIKSITLDVYDHDKTPKTIKSITADNDTRYIAAEIQCEGARYDIGESAAVELIILRPDKVGVDIVGSSYAFSYDTPGETITYYGVYAELDQVALAKTGTLLGQFKITSGEQILRTELFKVNNGRALDAETSDWAGEYQGYNLDELVQNVNESVAKVDAMEQDVTELKSGMSEISSKAFSSTAKVLLISLLKNAVYTSDQTDTIDALDTALNIGDIVAVTGISLDASTKTVTAGSTVTITATVTPSNATNKGIVWTSSDKSVVTVSGGIVTGVGNGTAVITAKTVDGGFTATCSVTSTVVNLLDRSKSSVSNYVNRDNGQIVSSDTFDATDLIWLEPNTTYYSEGCYLENFYAFYNANKVYVSSPPASVTITSEPDRNWGAHRKGTIVTGSQGYYFRGSYNKAVAYTPYIALVPIE